MKISIPKLIPDWKQAWRYYTVWGWACVINLPQLYTMLAASPLADKIDMGAIPEPLSMAITTLGIAGLVSRFIDQNKPTPQ